MSSEIKKPPVSRLAVFRDWLGSRSGSSSLDRLRREIKEPEKIRANGAHGRNASIPADETPRLPPRGARPAPRGRRRSAPRRNLQREPRSEGHARGVRAARSRREAQLLLARRRPGRFQRALPPRRQGGLSGEARRHEG